MRSFIGREQPIHIPSAWNDKPSDDLSTVTCLYFTKLIIYSDCFTESALSTFVVLNTRRITNKNDIKQIN